ncbi:DUF4258 domain-containing protein [Algoriphagus marincola]|uniref:DUF4258 domain-containing protein n=1 Tax=Algoriphagus marincola TaxID=264027 RepID=UPI0004296EB2
MKFTFSIHALEQLKVREIPRKQVIKVLENPDQVYSESDGNEIVIYQSVFRKDTDEAYLIRVFVNQIKSPNLVITAYRTSKVQKYWKDESGL